MLAAVLTKPGQMEIRQVDVPLADDRVLVSVAATGICGLYDGKIELPVACWFRRGLRLVASRMTRRRVPEAVDYMRRHPSIASLVTHRIGLAELPETMVRLERRDLDALKVLVQPGARP